MIKKEMEAGEIEQRVHDLANAMNNIRSMQADRDDVVVEMKDTKRTRLELLFEDLEPVINDIPKENEQFDFAVTKGEVPRLWVDMTSFVRMGSDGREYEFVKDTRMGRVILGHGSSRKKIGEHVTNYVAERLLERERMIEGDWLSLKHMMENYPTADAADKVNLSGASSESDDTKVAELNKEATQALNKTSPQKAARHSTLSLFVWFLTGLIAGAGILFILTWFGLMEQIVQWVQ